MANSSTEWWDIDGVSLHQFGWSVTTVGGSRYDLPPRRGDNITLAYKQGQAWRPKPPDQRPITLPMFLTGMDPATGNATGDEMLRWNDSWDFLRRLVWRVENRMFALTRRTLLTQNGLPGILTTTAQAELAGTMAPTMSGRTRAEFEIDLNLPDPYFYGAVRNEQITNGGPGSTLGVSVFNPGMDLAAYNHFQVTMTGPLSYARLTNATPVTDVWLLYYGVIPEGERVVFDVGNFTATASWGENVIRNVVHSGAHHWMGLEPGNNLLTFGANAGIGGCTITYQPPYV